MPIYLQGLSAQYYRAIGKEPAVMQPFHDFNFFIGSNNSGKSTILDLLYKYVPRRLDGQSANFVGLAPVEEHKGANRGGFSTHLCVRKSDIISKLLDLAKGNKNYETYIHKLIDFFSDGEYVWLTQIPKGQHQKRQDYDFKRKLDISEAQNILDKNAWYNLWITLNGTRSAGSLDQHWFPETISIIRSRLQFNVPKVELIPAIREISASSLTDGIKLDDFSGKDLIDWLFRIQVPDYDKQHEREGFDKVNALLQSVTGVEDAEIAIPSSKAYIYVRMNGLTLPLSQLGTGVHHLIMIAAFCTMCHEKIVCIEEPELYLHPVLQRKLIKYLRENTENQYFISTHSAAFIDTPGAAIFHVKNDGDHAVIRNAQLSKDKFEICNDLGYRASDIMQSNAVMWVEGPSDRIYLKHWIRAVDPDLVEGIHYSIMFYGGRLLSHLSASDQEVSDFIALRALNQNLALIMDSDRHSVSDTINDTKQRLRKEFEKDGGVCWITQGREIENYIETERLDNALTEIYANYDAPSARGDFENNLHFMRYPTKGKNAGKRETYKDADKVQVARIICKTPADLTCLDLEQRIDDLVRMIRRANGLD